MQTKNPALVPSTKSTLVFRTSRETGVANPVCPNPAALPTVAQPHKPLKKQSANRVDAPGAKNVEIGHLLSIHMAIPHVISQAFSP